MILAGVFVMLTLAVPLRALIQERREIKDLEYEKKQIENLFAEGKVADADITKKAEELQAIINKLEAKEERWFELSSKMEE